MRGPDLLLLSFVIALLCPRAGVAIEQADAKRPKKDRPAEFFNDPNVRRLEINLSEEAQNALRRSTRTYVSGTMRDAGRAYTDVGVHLKGMVGSSRVDLQACKLEYSIVSPK